MDNFTQKLAFAIKQSGLKQIEIAKKIGISKQCITDFKTGKSYPSIQTLALLCKILDISADYLLGIEDEAGRKTCNTINNHISDNHGIINQKF